MSGGGRCLVLELVWACHMYATEGLVSRGQQFVVLPPVGMPYQIVENALSCAVGFSSSIEAVAWNF